MTDAPVYTSPGSVRSLWQTYRIYDDHLEFDSIFGRLTVPFDRIEDVSVVGSDLKRLVKGELTLRDFRPALKLDWANFMEHVVVDKTGTFIRRVLFTPEDPGAFKRALDEALARYRRERAETPG